MMKLLWFKLFHLLVGLACGFSPAPPPIRRNFPVLIHVPDFTGECDERSELDRSFREIAAKLRTSIRGNGFDSRDPQYGVESIRAVCPIRPGLGLELCEVAHSTTRPDRGLVLVATVGGNAAQHTAIRPGDTIVGVSCPTAGFQESTAGLDYDATMDAIVRAKTLAEHHQPLDDDDASIVLQLNRLVPRAPIQVEVETESGAPPTILQALAGDNLRLLLKQNQLYFSANDCGGEGICGTDTVEIVQGEDQVEYLGTSTSKRRKACQTILGCNNQATTIKIRLLFA